MARLVQSKLKAPLANEILFGKLAEGGIAVRRCKDGEIVITCESLAAAPATSTADDEPSARTDLRFR